MSRSLLPLAILFLLFQFSYSQTTYVPTFGEPTQQDFSIMSYPPDPEATGVVLYERGDYSVENREGYIMLIKKIHRKIKVFDANKFTGGTVEIPYYNEDDEGERVTKITAITHNGISKKYLASDAIFDVDEFQNWSAKRFTFPDIQDGSILEYIYTIETPYFGLLGGWSFMNDLPTLYSELHTEIPGNFTYNRTLYGNRKLDEEMAEIKKSCFHLPGFKVPGDCESATYAMKNIPAFKKEEYMLSPNNYKPSIKFELAQIIDLDESRRGFAKTWKELDNTLKYHKKLGRQLKNTGFFKDNLPSSLLSTADKMERAKGIFYHIQKQMTWNKWIGIYTDKGVKEAYEQKSGNSAEVNLSLANALIAAGLDAQIMLLATRKEAIPSKQYPVRTDFNYSIVFLQIGKDKYFLDATEKYAPFGTLPLRALNITGRVLDFKKGSYWEPIVPQAKNMHYINAQLTANPDGIFTGKISEVSTGHISIAKREAYNDFTKEEQIKRKQSNNEFLNISDLAIENATDLEQPYKEEYNISLYGQQVAQHNFLYPFFMQKFFAENPFQKEKRLYPIDFGFPVINNYLISIDLADVYKVEKLPENKLVRLPEDDGSLSVVYDQSGSKVNIRLSLRLNNTSYPTEAYKSLQEFFSVLMGIQKEEPLSLIKI